MSSGPVQATWDELLRSIEHEAVKAGYRRSGSWFFRADPAARFVTAFWYQVDSRSPAGERRFCVNLHGYAVRLVPPPLRMLPTAQMVKRANPHWRDRLTPEPGLSDYWWEIPQPSDAADRALSDWHVRSVADAIVPALAAMGSEDSLLATWLAGTSPGLTAVQCGRHLEVLLRARAES